jgi:phosphoribosyl-ATP pyrophosphohydrolase/phosphoribosyl-AMP cyclohydrolase
MDYNNIKWDDRGLIPAVIQDNTTSSVLMVGYMNKDSLKITIESGEVTFFSRSKNRLWTKGEESGNKLMLSDIGLDCDKDTLLVKALPLGPTCHTGTTSCFDDKLLCTDMIKKLEGIIDERAASTNTDSYIVSLFNKGVKEIAKKVNEEAGETAISAVTNDGRIIEEAADLVFHLLVLLRSQNKTMKDVTDKLYERSINQ